MTFSTCEQELPRRRRIFRHCISVQPQNTAVFVEWSRAEQADTRSAPLQIKAWYRDQAAVWQLSITCAPEFRATLHPRRYAERAQVQIWFLLHCDRSKSQTRVTRFAPISKLHCAHEICATPSLWKNSLTPQNRKCSRRPHSTSDNLAGGIEGATSVSSVCAGTERTYRLSRFADEATPCIFPCSRRTAFPEQTLLKSTSRLHKKQSGRAAIYNTLTMCSDFHRRLQPGKVSCPGGTS